MRKKIDLCFRIVFRLSILLLLLSSIVLAQEPESKNRQEVRIWRQRVADLTDGIRQDSSSLDPGERGIYFALLGKILWKTKPLEARDWSLKAVEYTVSSISSSEENTDLSERLKQADKTIQIVAESDYQLSETLAEKIAKILETVKNNGKPSEDSFVSIALQVVDTKPSLAFSLGAESLNYGNSLNLSILISKLNSKNSLLAENLFVLALAAARRNFSYEFTGGLGNILFETNSGPGFSVSLKRSFLELLAEMISRGSLIESEREIGCQVAPLATPILDKFDEFLPSMALTVRQQVQFCIPFSNGYTAEIAKAEANGDEPRTVNDLIQAARDTNDPGLKGRYYYKAITKLKALRKFDEIISLLDEMTEIDKKAISSVAWESWRIEYAFLSAFDSFERQDMPSVYRTINRTPKKSRPFVRFRLIYKLSPTDSRDFILENLEQIRKEIGSSLEITPKDAASSYLSLARLYIKIQPTESEKVFRDATRYINKTDDENPDFLAESDYAPLQDYIRIPFEFLETDETGFYSSLANISSRRSRIRLKLGFLESAIQRLSQVMKKLESEISQQKVKEKS